MTTDISDNKLFCTAPWVGITVREDGHVRTCCIGKTSLGNLNQNSIVEILQSHPLKQIQQRMLSGEPDLDNCRTCIDSQNRNGLTPIQEHYNKFYPEIIKDQIELKFLDIRWNNLCNLGCMYCDPMFSSVWQDRQKIKRASVVKDYQDELLDWILEKSHQIKEILLVGGEPMLMKQNYALINQLSDECRISVITNLSYNLPELPCTPKLLNRPRSNTVWNVSLDNTGMQFEYVRNGGNWSQIEKNLKYLNQHWSGLISINYVYSMFSAFSIVETIQTLNELGIKKINLLPIASNHTMNLFNMPAPIRQLAAEQIKLAQQWHFNNLHPEDKDLYPLQGTDAILEHLEASVKATPITSKMFFDKINWYDQYNQQKFKDLWPNVIDLVEKYL